MEDISIKILFHMLMIKLIMVHCYLLLFCLFIIIVKFVNYNINHFVFAELIKLKYIIKLLI